MFGRGLGRPVGRVALPRPHRGRAVGLGARFSPPRDCAPAQRRRGRPRRRGQPLRGPGAAEDARRAAAAGPPRRAGARGRRRLRPRSDRAAGACRCGTGAPTGCARTCCSRPAPASWTPGCWSPRRRCGCCSAKPEPNESGWLLAGTVTRKALVARRRRARRVTAGAEASGERPEPRVIRTARADQALRAGHWPSTASTSTCARATSTASSAPTARARPRPCGCCSAWCSPPPGTAEVLGAADAAAGRGGAAAGRRAGRGPGGVPAPVRAREPRAASTRMGPAGARGRAGRVDDVLDRVGLGGVDDRPVRGVLASACGSGSGSPRALLRRAAAAGARRADQRPGPAGHPRDPRPAARAQRRRAPRSSCPATCSAEVEQMCTRVGVLDRGRLVVQERARRAAAADRPHRTCARPTSTGRAACSTAGSRSATATRLLVRVRDAAALNAPAGRRRASGSRVLGARAAHASRTWCWRRRPPAPTGSAGVARRDPASSCVSWCAAARTWVTILLIDALPTLVAVLLAVTDIGPRPGTGPAFLSAVLTDGTLFPLAAMAIVLPLFLPIAVAIDGRRRDRGRGPAGHPALPADPPGRAHPAAGGQAGQRDGVRAARPSWSSRPSAYVVGALLLGDGDAIGAGHQRVSGTQSDARAAGRADRSWRWATRCCACSASPRSRCSSRRRRLAARRGARARWRCWSPRPCCSPSTPPTRCSPTCRPATGWPSSTCSATRSCGATWCAASLLQGVYVLVFLGAGWANFTTKDITD